LKYLISSLLILMLLTGCTKERLILVPQSQDYPTFSTEDFYEKNSFPLEIWEEQDSNGTYLVGDKQHILDFIEWSKQNRSDYNTLLKQLKKFNTRIEELNKIQNSKKPQEVEDYDYR
jgi:TolA-binding protein